MKGELPEGWVETSLDGFLQGRGSSVDPSKSAEQVFELYSVPQYDLGRPELTKGSDIGSLKQRVDPKSVLLCKINPRINRAWIIETASDLPQIASTEWIVFPPCTGIDPSFLRYFLTRRELRDFLAHNVSGVGGSLMRVKPSTLNCYPLPLPPLNEQRRIADKIETLFARLDKGEEGPRQIQGARDP